jgi:hypothetical protein
MLKDFANAQGTASTKGSASSPDNALWHQGPRAKGCKRQGLQASRTANVQLLQASSAVQRPRAQSCGPPSRSSVTRLRASNERDRFAASSRPT